MRSLVLTLLLAMILSPVTCYTQEQAAPEKGDIKEIAKLSKVYLSADSVIARKRIVKELKSYKNITVVDSSDEAEFFIEYKVLERKPTSYGIFGVTSGSTISEMVVYTLSDKWRRPVWSKTWAEDGRSERNEVILTRSFIKAFKKASGTK